MSFADLQDCENAEELLAKTLNMSAVSDEDWRSHYDALDNLRILNKFHQE
jgi:hypothetical protein